MKKFLTLILAITVIFSFASRAQQNVGIGTTNPLQKLHIGGAANTLRIDGRQQVVQVVGRCDIAGQQVIDLAEGEVTLLLANLYNVVFILIRIFSHDCAHSCEKFQIRDAVCAAISPSE